MMKRPSLPLILILLLATALRLGYGLSVSNEVLLEVDGRDYHEIAANLAAGKGFSVSHYRWFEPTPPDPPELHEDLYRPPLVPILGAFLFLLPGDWFLWARILSTAMGCALVFILYLLGRHLFGRTTGLLAALILAVYPYAVYYSARWSTEGPFALAVAAGILFLVLAVHRSAPWYMLPAGLALGLASLARPTGLAFLAAFVLFSLVKSPPSLRWRSALLLMAGGLLILAPWTLRNHRVTGRVNPATFFGDYNMWLGMNDRMYEMYRAGQSEDFLRAMNALYHEDLRNQVRRLEEEGRHDIGSIGRHWREQAAGFARRNPEKALYIVGQRFLHFWRPWPNRATVPPHLFWISIAFLVPLFLLAILALILSRRLRSPFLIVPCLVTLAACLPFVFHLRFRYPTFEPYLVLLASAGAVALATRRPWSRPPAA
jgi:4-amino-4-deoxy-L-arabinose transferase-like glycosyltransferase